jgi:hypothetical protein
MGSTSDVTSEAGTSYPTWLPEFISGFGRGCVGLFSVFIISELCLPFLLFTVYLGFVVLCWFMVFVHVLVPSDFTWWNEWSGYKYSNTKVNANSHRKPEVVSGASWKAQIYRLINDTSYVIIIIFKQNYWNRNLVPIDNTDMFRLLVVIPNRHFPHS